MGLVLSQLRRYQGDKEFYLAKGVVIETGRPKTSVSRWNAEQVLRTLEKQYGVPEDSLRLPSLYESHKAAEQDPEVRQTIFTLPAEWQRTLVLNPNASTETPEYVIMDANKNQVVIQPSNTPRSLNPIKTYREGDRNVVVANVFDIPFALHDSRYNPEDLDQETGFLKKTDPNGQFYAWFGSNPKLYSVFLLGYDNARCNWEPSDSRERVGLRGVSNSRQDSILFEPEADSYIEN